VVVVFLLGTGIVNDGCVVKWMDGTTSTVVQIVCVHISCVHTHSWYYHGTGVTTDIQEMSTI
jgi:hypothetical protein